MYGGGDSSVGITMGYVRGGRLGFGSRQLQAISFYSRASRLAVRLTQPPIKWEPGVRWPGRVADHSHPSISEVKDAVIPPLPHHHAVVLNCLVN
jgi:hypothetical protein